MLRQAGCYKPVYTPLFLFQPSTPGWQTHQCTRTARRTNTFSHSRKLHIPPLPCDPYLPAAPTRQPIPSALRHLLIGRGVVGLKPASPFPHTPAFASSLPLQWGEKKAKKKKRKRTRKKIICSSLLLRYLVCVRVYLFCLCFSFPSCVWNNLKYSSSAQKANCSSRSCLGETATLDSINGSRCNKRNHLPPPFGS